MSKSNKDRTAATRGALITAARTLFAEKGYAETGTPEIVAKAAVTRGALYHHFTDKADLLRAVIMAEAQAIAADINDATDTSMTPAQALTKGADAYFETMAVPGRARLLLLEGPAALGADVINEIDRETGGQTLLEGLQHAAAHNALGTMDPAPLADMLSAAFDRAALAIANGTDPTPYRATIAAMLTRLLG